METDTPTDDETPPPAKRSGMRWGCGCLALALLLPVAGFFALIKIPMWTNDERLDAFAERFFDYPLPPATEFADHDAQGSVQLRGNGNHCDYLVRFSLRSELSDEEVVRYYEQAEVPGVDGGRAQVTVFFAKHVKRSDDYWYDPIIVQIADSTDPGWDIRCH